MKSSIAGRPAFAHIEIELDPGESIIAEPDAMAHMDPGLRLSTGLNGGFFPGLARKFLGGESLFINTYTNPDNEAQSITLTQSCPGDMIEIDLAPGQELGLSGGSYIASTPSVQIGTRWAGIGSMIAGEGLFKLKVTGPGKVWIGAYGGIIPVRIEGEQIIDSGHLVAWEPSMKLKTQLSGGLISSMTSGEGLVTRVEGNGTVYLQSRSLDSFAGWVNSRL